MPSTSSFDLAERMRSGDEAAFARVFDRYRRRLAVWIHYRMGENLCASMEAADLVQETFVRAWRDAATFHYGGRGSLFRWLAAIAAHVIADAARAATRPKRHAIVTRFRSESHPGGPEPTDSATPSRLLSAAEDLQALIRSLDALPENYRQVLLMAKIEGLTTAEIAERTGLSRESVALTLHRAVKRFRGLRENG